MNFVLSSKVIKHPDGQGVVSANENLIQYPTKHSVANRFLIFLCLMQGHEPNLSNVVFPLPTFSNTSLVNACLHKEAQS